MSWYKNISYSSKFCTKVSSDENINPSPPLPPADVCHCVEKWRQIKLSDAGWGSSENERHRRCWVTTTRWRWV